MSISKHTMSNTRLLSLIVLFSVFALSVVMIGGNHADDNQLNLSDKPVYLNNPVSGSKVKFPIDSQAIILTI